MGTFSVPIEIGNLASDQFVQVDALVDTGATFTTLPSELLDGLGIQQIGERSFQLADNRVVRYKVGEARIRLEGEELTVLVVFAPADTSSSLGATALELFGLAADPVNRRLTPVPAILKSIELNTNIKVLLAKLGLDGHDRGVKVVARALRDAGMEVVYLGMRVTPDQIARAALQEDADVVGLSILSGAHMRLVPRLTQALDSHGLLGEVLLVVGGTIPDSDVEPLERLGVQGVFPVGTFTTEMIDFIRAHVQQGRSPFGDGTQ